MKIPKIELKTENMRIIDELSKLLGLKSTYEFHQTFGVAFGTLSNINNGKSRYGVEFGYLLAYHILKQHSETKRKKIIKLLKKIFP